MNDICIFIYIFSVLGKVGTNTFRAGKVKKCNIKVFSDVKTSIVCRILQISFQIIKFIPPLFRVYQNTEKFPLFRCFYLFS